MQFVSNLRTFSRPQIVSAYEQLQIWGVQCTLCIFHGKTRYTKFKYKPTYLNSQDIDDHTGQLSSPQFLSQTNWIKIELPVWLGLPALSTSNFKTHCVHLGPAWESLHQPLFGKGQTFKVFETLSLTVDLKCNDLKRGRKYPDATKQMVFWLNFCTAREIKLKLEPSKLYSFIWIIHIVLNSSNRLKRIFLTR